MLFEHPAIVLAALALLGFIPAHSRELLARKYYRIVVKFKMCQVCFTATKMPQCHFWCKASVMGAEDDLVFTDAEIKWECLQLSQYFQ